MRQLDIGRLNKRITFLKPGTTTDSMGAETPDSTFVEYKTVWATVNPLRGGEYWQAQRIRAESQYKITIRYKDWVVPTMRISFKDKIFRITSVIDVESDGHFMEIYATEYVDTHEEA